LSAYANRNRSVFNISKLHVVYTVLFVYIYISKLHVVYTVLFVYISVVVLCASADSVRKIMIKAHELNFDNGEYVFFNIDLFSR